MARAVPPPGFPVRKGGLLWVYLCSGPTLKRYIRIAPATRPYFQAAKDAPTGDFAAEADRHPVFELTPIGEGQR